MPNDILNKMEMFDRDPPIDDRVNFARKVLGIVFVQVLATFALGLYASYSSITNWFDSEPIQILTNSLGIFAFSALYCSKTCRQSVPLNYFFLAAVTWMEAFLVAEICQQFEPKSVLICEGATLFMFLCLFRAAYKVKTNEKLVVGLFGGMILSAVLQLVFFIGGWLFGV